MYDTLLEIVGYVASAIVLVSFFMSSVVKLRLVNLIGAAIFTAYAFLTRTYPTALMNLCIVVVDIYYLVKLSRRNAHYTALPTSTGDPYFSAFLEVWGEDIRRTSPELEQLLEQADTLCLTCCDLAPAGLLLGDRTPDGTLEVRIDYHLPTYRDPHSRRALYATLPGVGIRRLVWEQLTPAERKQLEQLGCTTENGKTTMAL